MTSRMLIIALAILVMAAQPAIPAELQLYPLRMELNRPHAIDAFRLTNVGDDDSRIQLTLSEWDQDDTGDVYKPTHDIMANPPLFVVPSKGMQTVRIGLGNTMCGNRELAYRAFFQEVPDATKAQNGIQTLLRISVPVFVPPANPTPAALDFTVSRQAGDPVLTIHNPGNAHVQITHMTLTSGGRSVYERGLSLYILPGRTMRWPLEDQKSLPRPLQVEADTDRGPIAATVSADDAPPRIQ